MASSSLTQECEQLASELRLLQSEHLELLFNVEQLHLASLQSKLRQQSLINANNTNVGHLKSNHVHLESLLTETSDVVQKLKGLNDRLEAIEIDANSCSHLALFAAKTSKQEMVRLRVALMHLWMAIVTSILQLVFNRELNRFEEGHGQDLRFALHAADAFNGLLVLWRDDKDNCGDESQDGMGNASSYINDFVLREFSSSRLMLMLAKQRAENVAKRLWEAVHRGFDRKSVLIAINDLDWIGDEQVDWKTPTATSSSKEASPTSDYHSQPEMSGNSHLTLIQSLVNDEQMLINSFVEVILEVPGLRPSNLSKTTKTLRKRMAEFYHSSLFHRVGHILATHMSLMEPKLALALANLVQEHLEAPFGQGYPPQVLPALHLLNEHLVLKTLTTLWDTQIGKCLVKVDEKPSLVENKGVIMNGAGTQVGHVFLKALQVLTRLNNRCHPDMVRDFVEHGQHDPDEFPFVEELHTLHRLKATLVLYANYANNKGREALAQWRLQHFVAITQIDAGAIQNIFQTLQLARHERAAMSRSISVQLHVHVQSNLIRQIEHCQRLIQTLPTKNQIELFSVCKTNALAMLHNHFPGEKHWRSRTRVHSHSNMNNLAMNNLESNGNTSSYVKLLLESILQPLFHTLEGTSEEMQQTLGRIGVKALCEAWLHHILNKRIKFSEQGAQMLSTDFGSLRRFIASHVSIKEKARNYLLLIDSLRECEGVADILASNHDHANNKSNSNHVNNHVASARRNQVSPATNAGGNLVTADPNANSECSSVQQVLDVIPASLYVPNREAWLALRLHSKSFFSLKPHCCS